LQYHKQHGVSVSPSYRFKLFCVGSFRNHTRYGLGAETLPLDASSVTVCDCLLVYDMVLPYPFIIHRKQGCHTVLIYCKDRMRH